MLYVYVGYRMPMTWPFLSSMRNAAAVSSTTSQATAHLTPAQQLLLAPRTVHRRRYCKNCIVVRTGKFVVLAISITDRPDRTTSRNPHARTNAFRCSVTTTTTTTTTSTRACFVLLLRASIWPCNI